MTVPHNQGSFLPHWRMAPSIDSHMPGGRESPKETVLDVDEYDSYSWTLLEDHPLRSYPTQFHPGLSAFIWSCYMTMRKKWGDFLSRFVCLLLIFLAMIQFLSILPYGITYLLPHDQFEGETGFVRWPSEFKNKPSACISYNPQAHWDDATYTIAAGCNGVKVDIWLQDDDLLVGSSMSSLNAKDTLSSAYLQPLLDELDTRNSAVIPQTRSSEARLLGLFENNPAKSFILLLEIRSSVQAAWPHLASQLVSLMQRDYLSYMNGTQIVPRPVTIVVTSRDFSELGRINRTDHDSIFVDASLETLTLKDYALSSEQDIRHPGHFPVKSWLEPPLLQNTYTATVNFLESIGLPHRGRFSRQQIETIRSQVRAAHERGLLARYEGIPCHSWRLRKLIWRTLLQEGADLIEVDWNACEGQWWRRVFAMGGVINLAKEYFKRP